MAAEEMANGAGACTAHGAEGPRGDGAQRCADAASPRCTKRAFDHKGVLYPSRKKMCKAYGIAPGDYLARLNAGVSKQEALTGRKPWRERAMRAATVIASVFAVLLFVAVHHAVDIPLGDAFFEERGIAVENGTVDGGDFSGQLGESVHVEYATEATVRADGSATCLVRNATEGRDVRFSVELALDNADGSTDTLAASDRRLAPGEQVDALPARRGAALPAHAVYGSFILTLYEGDSDEPLAQTVVIDSIIVSPGS